MIHNYPNTFALVSIHYGDGYATSWGNTRHTFLLGGGTPRAWFDDSIDCYGAYENVTQQYNWYRNSYLTRQAVATDVWIEMSMDPIDADTFRVSAEIGIDAGGTAKTMRVNMVQVLDNYPTGQSYPQRNTLMQGAAYQIITVQPGESTVIANEFTLNATSLANPDDVKFIAWAQMNNSSAPAQVYNTAVLPFVDPYPVGDMDCDGLVNNADIGPFVLAITNPNGPGGYTETYPDCSMLNGECSGDGMFNNADIPCFVEILTGGK